jgi:hypothetical protein
MIEDKDDSEFGLKGELWPGSTFLVRRLPRRQIKPNALLPAGTPELGSSGMWCGCGVVKLNLWAGFVWTPKPACEFSCKKRLFIRNNSISDA